MVIKNGKHAGIQLSKNESGEGFLKGILWVTNEEKGDYPVQVFNNIGKVPNDDWWDIAFRCDLENKEIAIIVKQKDWDEPYTESIKFDGGPVDYSEGWLWVACNNALEMTPEEDKLKFSFVSPEQTSKERAEIIKKFNSIDEYFKY